MCVLPVGGIGVHMRLGCGQLVAHARSVPADVLLPCPGGGGTFASGGAGVVNSMGREFHVGDEEGDVDEGWCPYPPLFLDMTPVSALTFDSRRELLWAGAESVGSPQSPHCAAHCAAFCMLLLLLLLFLLLQLLLLLLLLL